MRVIDFESIKNILDNNDSGKLVIGFFIDNNSVSQDEWMNPLADSFKRHNCITVGIMTKNSYDKCNMSSMEYVVLMEMDQLEQLDKINILFCIDMDKSACFSPKTKVIACIHAFETRVDTSFNYQLFYLSAFDAALIPFNFTEKTRELTKQLWTGIISREDCKRKGKHLELIPAPYPRMIVLTNELATYTEKPDAIVYAPTLIDFSLSLGGERIRKYGASIIDSLLSNFPDIDIIFRPYKDDIKCDPVKKIIDRFKNKKRFQLDDNPGRFYSFSHAEVLVTDISHIARTFSYATLRPSIYFQPWKKLGNSVEQTGIGFNVSTIKSLISSIKFCQQNMSQYNQTLLKLRNYYSMPLENGFNDIITSAIDFYNGECNDSWISIERLDTAIEDFKLIGNILSNELRYQFSVVSFAASERRPISNILLAYALHLGKILVPGEKLRFNLADLIADLYPDMRKPYIYNDINNDIIRNLYSIFINDSIIEQNSEAAQLGKNLLISFDDNFPAS